MTMVIVGPNGENWRLEELSAWFGAEIEVIQPEPHPEASKVARVVELRVHEGPSTQMVHVQDEKGDPVAGVQVCRWWAGAPALGEFPAGCHASRYRDNAVHGPTNENGDVGFGMGGGDMPGSSGVWIADCDCPSGWVGGLGWKPLTNHAGIAVTFEMVPAESQPSRQRAHGIDVSSHQGDINWSAVKASGQVDFVMIRASLATEDGRLVEDPKFRRNRSEAKRLGIPYGAYHYFRQDVWGQARFFAQVVGEEGPPLGYWLDLEEDDLTRDKVLTGLEAADRNIGGKCGIYSNPKTMSRLKLAPNGRKLWLAHWDVSEPDVPGGWEWEFWQYGVLPEGSIPGILTRIDVDYFRGTKEELLGGGAIEQVLGLLAEAVGKIDEARAILEGAA